MNLASRFCQFQSAHPGTIGTITDQNPIVFSPFPLSFDTSEGVVQVNAAEQALDLETASKIATVVNLFKSKFPDARADLKPWANDSDTRELVDPDSIDIGFHFPGRSRLFQSRSILVQIRFYQDPMTKTRRAIGVEAVGFDHKGKQWRLSTIESWAFEGTSQPVSEIAQELKGFCREILELFNYSI